MATALTVVENFLEHKKGDIINDIKKVEEYLESEWAGHVMKITQPDQPQPAADKSAAPAA